MTEVLAATTAVPQERRLVTEVPGPRSREHAARWAATVSAGVSVTIQVSVERAGGGNVLRSLPLLVLGQDLLTDALDVLEAAFAAPEPGPTDMPPVTPS